MYGCMMESKLELTDKQREVLDTAREMGYFEVPRDATAAEIAEELDISPQAVSERMRRAISALEKYQELAELIEDWAADCEAQP